MVTIKKTKKKYWGGCGKIGTLVHYWWESKTVQPTMGNSVVAFQKIKLPYDPAI